MIPMSDVTCLDHFVCFSCTHNKNIQIRMLISRISTKPFILILIWIVIYAIIVLFTRCIITLPLTKLIIIIDFC